jgi:hypothetical protein
MTILKFKRNGRQATAITLHGKCILLFCRVPYEQFKYPAYETPLLDAYDGRFEAVFVMLHPFARVPQHLAWKTIRGYPEDAQISSQGQKCTWAEIYTQTGLNSCAKLNQALLASIGSIAEDLTDFEARDLLQRFLHAEPIWMPTEGRFEPLLQGDLLAAFEAAYCHRLTFIPEFPELEEETELEIAQLKSHALPFPSRGTLMPGDGSFLFTVDWDSFFTLFYGPRKFLTDVARQRNLEGFFAYPKMEHFWFNYSMGCATVTISPEHWPPVCADA